MRSSAAPPLASEIVDEVLSLRSTHPDASAADILALVASGRPRAQLMAAAEVAAADLTGPFGTMLTEAVDPCMSAREWTGLLAGSADAEMAKAVLAAWRSEVVERFLITYQSTASRGGGR